MSHVLRVGVVDQIALFRAYNTDGSGKTDFTAATAGASLSVFRTGLAPVSIASLTDKAADNTAHADGAIRQVAGNLYTVDLPDAATANQCPSVGVRGSYTGGVIESVPHPIVNYDPAVIAVGALQPTVAGRTLDVTDTGAAGIDWGNVENQGTINSFSETDIKRAINAPQIWGSIATQAAGLLLDQMFIFSATATTVTGEMGSINTTNLTRLIDCTAFVYADEETGEVVGQPRRITNAVFDNGSVVLTIDKPWDVIPSEDMIIGIRIDANRSEPPTAIANAIALLNTQVLADVSYLDHFTSLATLAIIGEPNSDTLVDDIQAVRVGLALEATLEAMQGDGFDTATDSLEAIRAAVDGVEIPTLTGPWTRTITVTDSVSGDPIQNATVRFFRTGEAETKATDASGVASFTVESATWSYAIVASGYAGASGTVVVDASGDTAVGLVLTSLVTPATAPKTNVQLPTEDQYGNRIGGVLVQFEFLGHVTGATITGTILNTPAAQTSIGDEEDENFGICVVQLRRLARYRARYNIVGDGPKVVEFSTGNTGSDVIVG